MRVIRTVAVAVTGATATGHAEPGAGRGDAIDQLAVLLFAAVRISVTTWHANPGVRMLRTAGLAYFALGAVLVVAAVAFARIDADTGGVGELVRVPGRHNAA